MSQMITTRDFSGFHEKNVAKALSGVRTSNSGATAFTKGDVIVGNCLIECKTKMSETKSFSIQKEWLDTIERERREMGKHMCAVAFSFDVGKSSYYVIDERMMKRLVELINNDE